MSFLDEFEPQARSRRVIQHFMETVDDFQRGASGLSGAFYARNQEVYDRRIERLEIEFNRVKTAMVRLRHIDIHER